MVHDPYMYMYILLIICQRGINLLILTGGILVIKTMGFLYTKNYSQQIFNVPNKNLDVTFENGLAMSLFLNNKIQLTRKATKMSDNLSPCSLKT